MDPFKPLWEQREPDFVNDLGVKWWKDDSTTHYAQRKDQFGTSLDAVAFVIIMPDGHRTMVLVSRKTEEIIEEDQSLEGLAVKIDIRKLLIRDHKNHPDAATKKKPKKPSTSATKRPKPRDYSRS